MSTSETVYLIDGNAYIHRAYHAIPPLSTRQGLPTNASFGFTNILLRVLRDKAPRFVAIAFDSKGPTFRHQMFAAYKANRPPMPDDLAAQLPAIRDIVRAYNIPTLERPGLEADDLIASSARRLAGLGCRVVIVSGDKDLLQLVDERITFWDPMQDRLLDAAAVREKYGVPPERLVELFALMGDSSDNVPGVAGVGPKTAGGLIAEHHTLEGVFAALAEIKRPKLRETLAASREVAFLSRDLVRLKSDAEVPERLEDYRLPLPDMAAVQRLFAELEFSRLLPETAECQPLATETFHLARTPEVLAELARALEQEPYLVVDTETSGLDTLTAELVGISLCGAGEEAWYLPLAHHHPAGGGPVADQLPLAAVVAAIGPLLADPRRPKVGHNLKFDYAILKHHGLPLAGPLWDTMIASYLVDPIRRSHKLDLLAGELLGIRMTSFAEVTAGSKAPDCFRFVGL